MLVVKLLGQTVDHLHRQPLIEAPARGEPLRTSLLFIFLNGGPGVPAVFHRLERHQQDVQRHHQLQRADPHIRA